MSWTRQSAHAVVLLVPVLLLVDGCRSRNLSGPELAARLRQTQAIHLRVFAPGLAQVDFGHSSGRSLNSALTNLGAGLAAQRVRQRITRAMSGAELADALHEAFVATLEPRLGVEISDDPGRCDLELVLEVERFGVDARAKSKPPLVFVQTRAELHDPAADARLWSHEGRFREYLSSAHFPLLFQRRTLRLAYGVVLLEQLEPEDYEEIFAQAAESSGSYLAEQLLMATSRR